MRSIFLLTVFIVFRTTAQDGPFNFGARSAGLADASLTLADSYSLFNNIGALGALEKTTILAGYQNRFSIKEFQVIGGGVIIHHALGNAGIGYYKFGDQLYNQQRIHLAIGNQIDLVSLGIGVDLIQYHLASFGTKQVLSIEFGGLVKLSSRLHFGAHVFNLNQASIDAESNEKVPTVMKGGCSYRPSEELMINVEVVKDLGFKEIIRIGIEYQIIEKLFLRTGISSDPIKSSFGLGLDLKHLKLDYAISNYSPLGNIHDVSIQHPIGK